MYPTRQHIRGARATDGHGRMIDLADFDQTSSNDRFPTKKILPFLIRSKSCYSHIRELRCIRPYLDSKTTSTIAASIAHSKLDYCNSLYYNVPKSQLNRPQQIQNCLACTVVKAPKSCHIIPILRSLHWLKINERIEYKLLSLTYNVLTTSQPDYLYNLISVQAAGRTCSSSLVTLA